MPGKERQLVPPGETESLVARRRRLVQDEIGQSAMDLFVERGFDQVSVDDIAAATGMSQRTFFRYFASKDDVLLRYQHRLHERLCRAFAARPEDEPAVTALRSAYLSTSTVPPGARADVHRLAQVLADAPALWARAIGNVVVGGAEPAIELARRMGLPTTDPRPRVIAAAMGAGVATAWNDWVRSDGSADPSDGIAAALDLLDLERWHARTP